MLADVAVRYGLGPPDERAIAAVTDEWEEGRRRGVVGSPHFFAGGHDYFCPALDIRRVDGHLQIRPDTAALEQVLAAASA